MEDVIIERYTGAIAGLTEVVVERPPIRRVTPLAFSRRLSEAAILRLTLAASVAMDGGDARLQVFLDDLSRAGVVDLDDPRTRAGIDFLVAAGLIDADEAAALTADGLPAEAA